MCSQPSASALRGRLGVVEVAVEHRCRANQDLAVVADAHLDVGQRPADRVQLDLADRLRGGQRARSRSGRRTGFRLHAERAEEQEGVLADGLAARVGVAACATGRADP